MRKNKFKYLMLLPLTAIVSCGYSTSYLVEGNKYVSAVFTENYYTHWDSELKSATKKDVVDVTSSKVTAEVNYGYDAATHKLEGLQAIDPNFYQEAPDIDEYGEDFKMNAVDDSFNYGYQSKLFDGQMVCGGQNGRPELAYQYGRVQIQEEGFSARFSKESGDLHYFAMNFKASTDNSLECYLTDDLTEVKARHSDSDLFHESKIELTITLYTKTLNGIEAHPFVTEIDLAGQVKQGVDYYYKTNNGHVYTFLAFDLEEYNLSRCVGVSVQFEILEDELLRINNELPGRESVNMTYALFLYEIFLPYTSWN